MEGRGALDAIVALLGALGAAGLVREIARRWNSTATDRRRDMRDEVNYLRQRVKQLEVQIESERKAFDARLTQQNERILTLTAQLARLQRQVDESPL